MDSGSFNLTSAGAIHATLRSGDTIASMTNLEGVALDDLRQFLSAIEVPVPCALHAATDPRGRITDFRIVAT